MSCYTVVLKSNDKQIKVFNYDRFNPLDRMRAKTLATLFAIKQANNGYNCIVESFHNQSIVGVNELDTEYPFI